MSQSSANKNKQLISLTPDTIVELFEIDFSSIQSNFDFLKESYGVNIGAEPIYRFCPMINGTNPIVWQGNSYQPLPVKMEGFEHKLEGKMPRPKLTISNPEGIFSKIVYSNENFINCKVKRKRTFVRFLDDENFQNKNLNDKYVNSFFGEADYDAHLPDDYYFINKKLIEDKNEISFELVSPLEVENAWVPARKILSNYCNWTYRCEIGCNYKGLPIETLEGKDLTKGFANQSIYRSNQGSVDPSKYTKMIDSVPSWSKDTEKYKLGDVVKIIFDNTSNPYIKTPQVFVCIKDHDSPSEHHPYLDQEHWAKDECQKTIESCKKRFTDDPDFIKHNRIEQVNVPGIRFGGFPGTQNYAIE